MNKFKFLSGIFVFLLLLISFSMNVTADNLHSDLNWVTICPTCDEDLIELDYTLQPPYLTYQLIVGTDYNPGVECARVDATITLYKLIYGQYQQEEILDIIQEDYVEAYGSGVVYNTGMLDRDTYNSYGEGKYKIISNVVKTYYSAYSSTGVCSGNILDSVEQEDLIVVNFKEYENPTIQIISPELITYDHQDINVEIQAQDNSEHVDIIYSIDNTNYNLVYNGITSRTFSEGTHTLYAMAIDPTGNRAYDQVTFTVDLYDPEGPTIQIINPEDGETYDYENVQIEIEASDDRDVPVVLYRIDGSSQVYTYDGIVTHTFSEGVHTIEAKAIDSDGLEAYDGVTFTVELEDNQDPTIQIIQPEDGAVYDHQNLPVEIEAYDDSGIVGITYSIDNQNYNLDYNGITTETFSEGTHTLYAKAEDPSGNEAFDQVTFEVDLGGSEDTTPPNAGIVINNDEPTTTSRNVVLSLTYSDDDSGVDACRYGQMVETGLFANTRIGDVIRTILPGLAQQEMQWTGWQTCTPTKDWVLTEGLGMKTVYYQVRDNAGNIAQAQDSIELISGSSDDLQVLFTINPIEGYAPLKVEFSAVVLQGTPSSQGYTYELITGDSTGSGERETQDTSFEMSHTYNNVGTYTAKMIVCDANMCVERTQEIVVYPKQIEEQEEEQIEEFYEGLHIDNIIIEGVNSGSEYVGSDDTIRIIIKMTNYGSDLEDLKVAATIDDMGLYMPSGNFDLDTDETEVKIIEIPLSNAEEKMHDIRIVVSNEQVRRVKYRGFKIIN